MFLNKKETRKYLSLYFDYLKYEKSLSENSIISYINDLKIFYMYSMNLKERIDLMDVNVVFKCIEDEKQKGKSKKSINRLLSSIKGFVLFCCGEMGIKKSSILSIESLRVSKSMPQYLSKEEVGRLIDFEDEKQISEIEKIILILLYSLGVRVSELCAMKTRDIDFDTKLIKVLGKGKKERFIPMNDRLMKYLEDYILLNRLKSGYLLGNVSRQYIWGVVKKRAEMIGLNKRVYPHLFRHTFASHLSQNGAKIREVQELLGHQDIQVTQIYTHLNKDHLKKVLNDHHKL